MKRRKMKKRWIVLVLILLVLLAAVAIFFWTGANSQEKKQYEARIQEQTQEMKDTLLSELDRADTSDEGLSQMEASEEPSATLSEAEKQLLAQELAKLEDQRKQKVLQALSITYSKVLNEQKQTAIRMVSDLVEQAKADWAALVTKGENTTVNKGRLASEYLAKSKAMETQMDAAFQALLDKMKEQLEAEDMDPAPIIQTYKDEYKIIKEENRSALLDKAMEALK